MKLENLKQEIKYQWREGPGGKRLAYITARDVMDLLDEVVGAENWQCDYKELGGKMYCGIAIRSGDGVLNDWVWKWDMGTESEFDADKGEASDAFKRAAVKWGVGRFLYDIGTKETSETPKTERKAFIKDGEISRDNLGHTYCVGCGRGVSKKVESFSLSKFGKVLCMSCQKEEQ